MSINLRLGSLAMILIASSLHAQQGTAYDPVPTQAPPPEPTEIQPRRNAPTTYTPSSSGYENIPGNTAVMGSGTVPRWGDSVDPNQRTMSTSQPDITINNTPPSNSSGGGIYAGGGYHGGFGMGWGYQPNSMGYGYALMGTAEYTRAAGQYWNEIESARMSREKVSQEQINTQRKRVEWEMEYEKLRPTAIKMRDKERSADLNWARNDPPRTEIWSGRTLNILLRSILASPNPTRGPNITLDPSTLRGLNLNDGTTKGSLSMAKDQGRIDWTDTLQEAAFDDLRSTFTRDYNEALKVASSGQVPERAMLQDLRKTLQFIADKLDDQVADLPPSRYIESRRLIRQLTDTVSGLSNPNVVRSYQNNWRASVNTVAQLVDYCMRNGMQFGPAAAAGDQPAYTAAYYAIRSYERGVAPQMTAREDSGSSGSGGRQPRRPSR